MTQTSVIQYGTAFLIIFAFVLDMLEVSGIGIRLEAWGLTVDGVGFSFGYCVRTIIGTNHNR
jgi:hypothetical protein